VEILLVVKVRGGGGAFGAGAGAGESSWGEVEEEERWRERRFWVKGEMKARRRKRRRQVGIIRSGEWRVKVAMPSSLLFLAGLAGATKFLSNIRYSFLISSLFLSGLRLFRFFFFNFDFFFLFYSRFGEIFVVIKYSI
jgi:hypothetical protein